MNTEERKDLTSKIELLIKNSIVFIHDDIDEQKFIVDPDGIDVIINTVVEALKKDEGTVKRLAIDSHTQQREKIMIDGYSGTFKTFVDSFILGFSAALKFDEE